MVWCNIIVALICMFLIITGVEHFQHTCWPFFKFFGDMLFKSFSSVQSLSCVQLFATPWIAARQASLSITNSWSLHKLMSIESVMPYSYLIFCRSLLLLPPIPPSIRVFSNESTFRMRWPKYWSFSFNISPSNEHLGLISFRMDWLDLLAVQGTLKSFLQHHFPGCSEVKASACNVGDLGLIPGSGRSPGEGNGNHSSTLAWRIP